MRFSSLLETIRAGMKTTPEEINSATEIELFLRNASRQIIGSVRITSGGGSAQIEIANKDASGTPRAFVQLLPSGDFERRIDVENVRVESFPDRDDRLLFYVDYRVRSKNAKRNFVYPFYLTES